MLRKDSRFHQHSLSTKKFLIFPHYKPYFLQEYTCPSCKHTLRRVHKKDGNYAWVCSSNDGGCGKWYDDVKAAPYFPKAEKCACGGNLKRVRKKDGSYAWVCESCSKWYDDKDGKPVEQKPKGAPKGKSKKKGA